MKLWTFFRRYVLAEWPWYVAGLVFLVITNWITLEIPMLAKGVVNGLEKSEATGKLEHLALVMVGLGITQILVRALSRIFVFWPGRKLEASAKEDFFGRILRAPQEFYQRFGMGDLVSRLSNDLGQLRAFFAFGALQFFNLILLVSMTVNRMWSVHKTLTLICLTPIILMLGVTRIVLPKMHLYSRLNQDALGRLTNRVTEAFMNVHVIQANAAEPAFIARAEGENEEVYRTNVRLIAVRTVFFPLLSSLTGISQLLVLFYGGHEIMAGRLSVGDILAFNIYLSYLAFPLMSLGIILSVYKRSRTALERLAVFETAPREPLFGSHALPAARENAPLLEFRNLTYDYPRDEPKGAARGAALRQLSFKVAPGEKIGLFGPVGSGKSTLFRLATRLATPPPGTVLYKGQDVLAYDPQILRQEMGYAQQNVHLFSESVTDNLLFGLDRAVNEETLAGAARDAQVLDEILKLEHGWNTTVGEKGVRLSGGQKQRLALTRVLLRRPKVFLLDDPFAAVDNRTEEALIRTFFRPEHTVILASHRIPALKACDRIFYLKDGELVASGSYRELVHQYPELLEEAAHDA